MIRVVLVFFVVLIYLLFLSTGDIQEDAYITFRVAFNLADFGELTFNLQENHNSATSFLYPRFVAFLRLLFKSQAILITQVANSFFLIIASCLMGQTLSDIFNLKQRFRFYNFIALALLPATTLMAARAVEMVYVVLLLSLSFYYLNRYRKSHNRNFILISCFSCILLPFVRVDAFLYALAIVTISLPIFKKKPNPILLSSILGLFSYFLVTKIMTGSWTPITIYAKSLEKETISFLDRLNNLWLFLSSNPIFLSPINSKFFQPLTSLIFIIVLLVFAKFLFEFYKNDKEHLFYYFGFFYVILVIPVTYAFMHAVFPWYFWPSHFVFQSVIFTFLHSKSHKSNQRILLYLFLILLTSAQLVLSFSNGYKENFRKNIGLDLRKIAKKDDRIFLEPAGYIPFFSELRTIDEVGLVTKITIDYKMKYKEKWWIELLKNEKPEFLLQREHILNYTTFQGYQLSIEEIKWFKGNYTLIKEFHYKPEKIKNSNFVRKILSQGTMRSYYLFKKKNSSHENIQ